MNEQEIRARFEARKLESQIEFERMMNEMNTMQTNLNHPSLDRDRELLKQRALLIQQKSAINIQLDAIQVERYDLEQKRKNINRLFHDLKHELSDKPARDEVVVGYWMSGTESVACLCYYDEETDEWTSTDKAEGITNTNYH